ncbi:MAG TPA: site-2 protease family protein [Methylomirabilota bacterium]
MPFWSRRTAEQPTSWAELFPLEALVRGQLDDVLVIQERRLLGRSLVFGGRLLVEPATAVDRLRPRLAPHGYTPFVREDQGIVWVHAIPQIEVAEPSRPLVHLLLFLATVVTTLLAGAFQSGVGLDELWRHPARLAVGLPFSAALLGILGVHEFGHYTVGRLHRMPVSLPYFIPVPPPFFLGTLGAVIRLRGAIRDRRALFDMAVAGPLAGLVVAIPVYVLGLRLSSVVQIPQGAAEGSYVQFGDALLPKLLEWLTLGVLPPDSDILLHPVGIAAWFGFLVTALNLIPAGQLDGGHIVYALFGGRHTLISKLAVGGLVVIGLYYGSLNWLVWAALIVGLMGFRHGPTMDDITPLDRPRRALGLFALVLLFLLLPPVPISVR